MRKLSNWFIGDFLKQNDDVFEEARVIMIANFIWIFGTILLIPSFMELSMGYTYSFTLHITSLAALFFLPIIFKRTQNVNFVVHSFLSVAILVDLVMVMIIQLEAVDTITVGWVVFKMVFAALLTRGAARVVFIIFSPISIVYILVNKATDGLFYIPQMYEAMEESPVFILFFPIALTAYVVWSYSSTARVAQANIKRQKAEIQQAHSEIKDSIAYARRIQQAILPAAKMVRESLPESFIFYRPKDVVAGDFYWLEKVNGRVIVAAADCTGHGVPGALVSVVCHNALNRATREFGLSNPAAILDKTREQVDDICIIGLRI